MNSVKVYIAGAYSSQERFKRCAAQLASVGIECTSGWLNEDPNGEAEKAATRDPSMGASFASADLVHVRNAHVFLCFTDKPSTTGGLHVEFGYALAEGLLPVIVGPVLNIFMALPSVVRFDRWGLDVVEFLLSRRGETSGYH